MEENVSGCFFSEHSVKLKYVAILMLRCVSKKVGARPDDHYDMSPSRMMTDYCQAPPPRHFNSKSTVRRP